MASTEQPAGPGTEPEPVLVTRYPNRRLYDRSQARYVTLQEIADLVRQGRTVTVRDSKTGEDLTRAILTQIILEYHPERMDLLPVGLLHALIRANDTALGFLRDYFRWALTYLEALQRPAAVDPFLQAAQWMSGFLPNPAAAQGPPAPAANAEAAVLARRLDELEKRLGELQRPADEAGPKAARQRKTRERGSKGGRAP